MTPKRPQVDPEDVLLWRMPRRRLEAEAIRDGIMTVSGGLIYAEGGSMLSYKDREYVANTAKGGNIDYDRPIRAVYIPVVRSSMYDVFQAFDLPDPSTSNGDRDSTVVAPQALFMMNSSVILQHSRKMATICLPRAGLDDSARIREAYERAFPGRPQPEEIDLALTFHHPHRTAMAGRQKQWLGRASARLCSRPTNSSISTDYEPALEFLPQPKPLAPRSAASVQRRIRPLALAGLLAQEQARATIASTRWR